MKKLEKITLRPLANLDTCGLDEIEGKKINAAIDAVNEQAGAIKAILGIMISSGSLSAITIADLRARFPDLVP